MELIIEYPLRKLQSGIALEKDATTLVDCCILCGKKIKNIESAKMIQLLTNGNIVSSSEDFDNSQGSFPVGNECKKRLEIKFYF